MSTISPQVKAAGENVAWQNQIAGQTSAIAIPELQKFFGNPAMGQQGMFSQMLGGMGQNGGMLPMDAANLGAATSQLNSGYQQAGFGQQQTIGYGGLRSGEGRLSPGAMNASMGSAATTLERQRQGALANLNFQSSQASMTDFNKLLGLMGQGAQTASGLAGGYAGLAGQAIGGLSPVSEMDEIMGIVGSTIGIAGKII